MRLTLRLMAMLSAMVMTAGCGVLSPPERATIPATPVRNLPTVVVAAEEPLHPVIHLAAKSAGVRVRFTDDAPRADVTLSNAPIASGRSRPWAESPLALGLWAPLAQSAAEQRRSLSLGQLARLAADARGWSILGEPQFGRIKVLHGHPASSASGALAVYGTLCAAGASERAKSAHHAVAVARRRVKRTRAALELAPEDRRRARAVRRTRAAHRAAVMTRTSERTRRCSPATLRLPEARSVLRDLQSAVVDTPANVLGAAERINAVGPAYTSAVIASAVEVHALDAQLTGSRMTTNVLPASRHTGPLRVRYHASAATAPGEKLLAALSMLVARDGKRLGLVPVSKRPVAAERVAVAVDDFAGDRRPVNLAVVIDARVSNVNTIKSIAERLSDRDRLAIIEAGEQVRVRSAPKKPSELIRQLPAPTPGARAAVLYDGVGKALETLRTLRDDSAANWVLVLTAGKDTGSSTDATRLKDLLQAQAYAEGREVRVYVVGEQDAPLKAAADASGGAFVASAAALPQPLAISVNAQPEVYAPSSSTAAASAPSTTSTP